MKKKVLLLVSVFVGLLLFGFSAYANELPETEEPPSVQESVSRKMGDVDADGSVTASDARSILRQSVSLDKAEGLDLICSDTDMNGEITAADARLALRASVSLETVVSHSFSVTEQKEASCTEKGLIKAKCADCETEISIESDMISHQLDAADRCKGEGICKLCSQNVTVTPTHEYETDSCLGKMTCKHCSLVKDTAVKHNLVNHVCTKCGYSVKTDCYDKLVDYTVKNGSFLDGVYVVEKQVEFVWFSLCYAPDTKDLYVYMGFGINLENGVMSYCNYLSIAEDFSAYETELDCYFDDELIAYGIYDVTPSKLSGEAFGSLTMKNYDSIPELSGTVNEYSVTAEGAVYDSVYWLISFAKTIGCNELSPDVMGFTSLK